MLDFETASLSEDRSDGERQKSEVLTGNLNVIYIRAYYAFTLPTMSLFRDYRVTEFAYHKGKKYTSP